MKALCACAFRDIEINDATYVINGIAYCEKACIDRVATHGRPFHFRQAEARMAATRIIGSFDGFKVEG